MDWIKNNIVWILAIVLGILLLNNAGLSIYNTHLKDENEIAIHNNMASQDSMKKLDNNLYLKTVEIGKLTKENKQLQKELKDSNDKIVHLSKVKSEVIIDTFTTVKDSIVYIDNTPVETHFKYNDEWLSFKGNSNISKQQTTITDCSIDVPLTFGITNNHKVFVKSECPYFKATDISGLDVIGEALAPKRKKVSFSHGIQLGAGITYGLINQKIDLGLYGGYGICISF